MEGVARADGHELQDARIAIAVNHATGATVANELGLVEVVDAAHGRFPEMAAIKIEVPIKVKVFVPAQATEFLGLLAEVALHLGERFGGIDHRIAARFLHRFDLLEYLDEFFDPISNQARIAKAEIARSERGQRIAES